MKNPKTGLGRIVSAFGYSLAGLKACFKSEAAFRQELVLSAILFVIALLVDVTAVERVVLIGVLFLVLIVELLNTAMEELADKISPEYDIHIKKAKDVGSAAVLLSLIFAGLSWLIILF